MQATTWRRPCDGGAASGSCLTYISAQQLREILYLRQCPRGARDAGKAVPKPGHATRNVSVCLTACTDTTLLSSLYPSRWGSCALILPFNDVAITLRGARHWASRLLRLVAVAVVCAPAVAAGPPSIPTEAEVVRLPPVASSAESDEQLSLESRAQRTRIDRQVATGAARRFRLDQGIRRPR